MKAEYIPTLESNGLVLRPWTIECAEDFLRINANPKVANAAGVKLISTIADAKTKIRAFAKGQRMEWSVAVKTEELSVIVGGIGISEVISIKEYSNVKEIGYVLSETYWGRGIIPKAVSIVEDYCFKVLGSEAVIVRIFEGNKQSERVAEKCGYKYHSKKKIGNGYKVNYIKTKLNV